MQFTLVASSLTTCSHIGAQSQSCPSLKCLKFIQFLNFVYRQSSKDVRASAQLCYKTNWPICTDSKVSASEHKMKQCGSWSHVLETMLMFHNEL